MWSISFIGVVLWSAFVTCALAQEETSALPSTADAALSAELAVGKREEEMFGDAPWIHKESPQGNGEDVVHRVVRLGRPLLPSGEEGGDVALERTPGLQISTEFLERLHLNPLKGGPVARSRLEMDPATGGLGLQKLEMGFEDRGLWLIHIPSTGETEGSMGVELKLRW